MLGRSKIARCLTMPNQNTDAEAALQKLGHRVRLGWAKKHPVSDKSLESVKNTVREQWEQKKTEGRSPRNQSHDAYFRCRVALMNFAKAAISSAIALIRKAIVIIFMVFL